MLETQSPVNNNQNQPDIIIIGGGLAGLFNALLLNKAGYSVTLIEKKAYPFHRVCGEYVSNEVLPFFKSLNINVQDLGASQISKVQITSVSGNSFSRSLELGGFGISRYTFDDYLYKKAKSEGVTFLLNTKVEDVIFETNEFQVITNSFTLTSKLVIGSFGKRSNLDQKLNRAFFMKRSPYVGVKYHIKADFPNDLVQLNNFKNGYCGIVRVEDDVYNVCYLVHRDELKKYHTVPDLEKESLYKNPFLKGVFEQAEFLWNKPKVINEISFEKKQPIENHIFMSGDTAGMITPLCGNGMSMGIHSAKILSESIIKFYNPHNFTLGNRQLLEEEYTNNWNSLFSKRLFMGRQLQNLFGNNLTTNFAINALKAIPLVADYLISKTHGKPF
ncbi:MAG: FAD-binding protein [Sphingobacteriales bacterium]|nr:FAD-binding protein [Sphingobacteriales bacterium]